MSVIRFQGAHLVNAAANTLAPVIDRTSPLQMDGSITIGVQQIPLNNTYTLTNATLARNAAGDVSINIGASQSAAIDFLIGEYFKECTTLLSTLSVPPLNNSGQYADGSGDTPFAKGSLITSLVVAYSIQGGPLTSFTAGMWLDTYVNGVANNLANPLAVAQNGLSLANTAGATTCTVTTIPIPTANQAYDVSLCGNPTVEFAIVTPAGCTFRLYGLSLQLTYNYL
jgi:hypothetical protein